ncbi:hypothetical protein [Streptomyces sp. NBC_01012]|uniref:hypothetical protein n=1 Tax=Streptomyces sp. NBC_01012 TaxID=2903717 RepID=UPI0038653CD5|nr:hypothetical protein OG623_33475 [Streptomyces sp. NBC_01012]
MTVSGQGGDPVAGTCRPGAAGCGKVLPRTASSRAPAATRRIRSWTSCGGSTRSCQEPLHHGAEIALLRDLHRVRAGLA